MGQADGEADAREDPPPPPAAAAAEPPATETASGGTGMGLFSTIAHELRGPLQAVALSLEVLADTIHDDQRDSQHLDRQVAAMRRQTVWLQELLENMLFADRLLRDRVQMQRQMVDLRSLIDEVRTVVDPLLAHRAQELRVSLAADLPVVPADPRRLGQVLINLLVNAAKYGPAAARIDVQATVQAAPDIEQGTEGPRVTRITVADRGPGVSASERPHVFTPFYRGAAASAAPGVGLGLGIVHAIVHAHGGRVGVRNRPRGGAAFWFELPIPDEPGEAARGQGRMLRDQRRTLRGRRRGASRA